MNLSARVAVKVKYRTQNTDSIWNHTRDSDKLLEYAAYKQRFCDYFTCQHCALVFSSGTVT